MTKEEIITLLGNGEQTQENMSQTLAQIQSELGHFRATEPEKYLEMVNGLTQIVMNLKDLLSEMQA